MLGEKRQRLLTLAALVCIGVLVADKVVVPPLYGLWSARADRIGELRERLAQGELLLDREETMQERWRDMQARSLSHEAAVAENEVLTSVEQWARDGGLSMTGLKPRWTRGRDGYRKLEVRASAQGNMAAVVRFLHGLETAPLAIRVEDVEIAARDDRGQNLSLDIRFSGLTLTEPEK